MPLSPVVLDGTVVRMEPLSLDHVPALTDVGLDPSLWALTANRVASEADMRSYVEQALTEQKAGTALPFATVERATGRGIGSSRFGNYVEPHRRITIGWT